ncbi:MAG TPA: CBS domain-containing protein [Polyangia bacterium]
MQSCGELMTWVVPVTDQMTALEVARIMRDNALGFLPVCKARSGRLVGVVTDRDLVTRLCADDARPSEIPVSAITSARPVTCAKESDVSEAEALMRRHQVQRLVILDETEHPVGVLSLADLLRREAGIRTLQTLREVLRPEGRAPRELPEAALVQARGMIA